MSRPTIFFDTRPRWLPRPSLLVASVAAGVVIGVAQWGLSPVTAEQTTRAQARPVGPAAGPTVATAAARPLASVTPAGAVVPSSAPPRQASVTPHAAAVSTMVSPGVHITPLSVPPGTQPTPAGPSPYDSEPEN